jgi:hypothetical protein
MAQAAEDLWGPTAGGAWAESELPQILRRRVSQNG